jgi:hypothetical protein
MAAAVRNPLTKRIELGGFDLLNSALSMAR